MSTLINAVKYFKDEPHQVEAFEWLESQLTDKQRETFLSKYRARKSDAKFVPSASFDFLVTPHITYGEIAMQQERRRFKHQYQCDVALEICKYLETVRSHFGDNAIIITSGYRPPEVNAQIGGATDSEHLYKDSTTGAIDFYIKNVDTYAVQKYCVNTWPYSVGLGAKKGFVHIGIRAGRPRVRWDY